MHLVGVCVPLDWCSSDAGMRLEVLNLALAVNIVITPKGLPCTYKYIGNIGMLIYNCTNFVYVI